MAHKSTFCEWVLRVFAICWRDNETLYISFCETIYARKPHVRIFCGIKTEANIIKPIAELNMAKRKREAGRHVGGRVCTSEREPAGWKRNVRKKKANWIKVTEEFINHCIISLHKLLFLYNSYTIHIDVYRFFSPRALIKGAGCRNVTWFDFYHPHWYRLGVCVCGDGGAFHDWMCPE